MADLRTEQQIRQELEAQRALMNDLSRGANLRKSDSKKVVELEKELDAVIDNQNQKKREQARIDKQIQQTTARNTDIMKTLNSLISKTVVEEKKMATQSDTVAKLKKVVNESSSQILNDIKEHATSNRVVNSVMREQVSVVESIMTGTNDIGGLLDQQIASDERLKAIKEDKAKLANLLALAERAGKESLAEKVRLRIQDLSTAEKVEGKLKKLTKEELAQLRAQKQKKSELGFLDQITGGLAGKAMEFKEAFGEDIPTGGYLAATAFLASMVAMANKFAGMVDSIGQQFGSLSVLGGDFRDTLLQSSVEATVIGGSIDDLNTLTANLASNFGINLDAAAGLSGAILDSSKAIGLSVEEGGNLFGILMQTANLSQDQAERLAEGTFQLARQAGVAPNAVLRDIASSTETIADFTKAGGDNIAEAAIQARSLGVSLETSAKVAKSLLDFESSVAAEVEASVLLGRQLNFQKARELALSNDISGAMADVVSQLGSEEEFNRLNVIQREALAKSIGVSTAELAKFVGEQEKATSLASMLAAGPGFEDLVGADTLSQITQFLNNVKALSAELTVALGPAFELIGNTLGRVAAGLRESETLMSILAGTAKITAIALMAKAIALTFSAFASLGGFGALLGVAAVSTLTTAYLSGVSKVQSVGDVVSNAATGQLITSPAEGTLVIPSGGTPMQLSPNDDFIAQPNLLGNFGTQSAMENSFGFKDDIIEGFKESLASVSLTTTIEHGDQKIAITPKLGGEL